jgi:ATP-binding cassette subfamily E protein 1
MAVYINTNTIVDYFTKILEDDLKAIVKPQYVDRIPKAIRSADKTVRALIEGSSSMDNMEEVLDVLGTSYVILVRRPYTNSNRAKSYHGP